MCYTKEEGRALSRHHQPPHAATHQTHCFRLSPFPLPVLHQGGTTAATIIDVATMRRRRWGRRRILPPLVRARSTSMTSLERRVSSGTSGSTTVSPILCRLHPHDMSLKGFAFPNPSGSTDPWLTV
ncbi:hypothetical protein Taro_044230 [Colocasia esculenta]|uniref:Uncharacterized protein n=1 Tax=Colocasia esculenta TaxID=4460 RepID=A0A843X0E1_COLES|nr:hypothetical protein [Colocasia esculenta]